MSWGAGKFQKYLDKKPRPVAIFISWLVIIGMITGLMMLAELFAYWSNKAHGSAKGVWLGFSLLSATGVLIIAGYCAYLILTESWRDLAKFWRNRKVSKR